MILLWRCRCPMMLHQAWPPCMHLVLYTGTSSHRCDVSPSALNITDNLDVADQIGLECITGCRACRSLQLVALKSMLHSAPAYGRSPRVQPSSHKAMQGMRALRSTRQAVQEAKRHGEDKMHPFGLQCY